MPQERPNSGALFLCAQLREHMVSDYNAYEDERPIDEQPEDDWRDSDISPEDNDEPTEIVDITPGFGEEAPYSPMADEGEHVHDWEVDRDNKYYGTDLTDEPPPQPYYPPQQAQPPIQGVDPQVAQALYQQNLQMRNQQVAQELYARHQQAAQAMYADLVQNQGWVPEQAAQYVQSEAKTSLKDTVGAIQQYQQLAGLNQQGKMIAAQQLAQHFGVDPRELMDYDSPQAMYRAAESIGRTAGAARYYQYQAQEAQRSRVPVQNYNQTGGTRNMSTEEDLIDRYISGDRSKEVMAAVRRNGIR